MNKTPLTLLNNLTLILLLPLALGVTFYPGIILEADNQQWNFSDVVSMDNLTVYSDAIAFENDIINFSSDEQINMTIEQWESSEQHWFTMRGADNTVNYTITVGGVSSLILYNGSYQADSFTAGSSWISWYYYPTHGLTITFLDAETYATIDETISIDFISDETTYSYMTNTSSLGVSLPYPVDYTVRYTAPSYEERFYYLNVTSASPGTITLYLQNSTTANDVTITVVDQATNTVEGARVKALRYNVTTNTYNLQEVGTTDSNGQIVMSLTIGDEYYKFIVEYDGELVYTSTPQYITTTSITLQITIGGAIVDYDRFRRIDYSLVFLPSSDEFRLTFSDVDGLANELCLYTYRVTGSGKTLTNWSCLTTNSGTILLPVTPLNDTTYQAIAYYYDTGNARYLLDSLLYTYSGAVDFGTTGLIMQIAITGAFIGMSLWSLPVAAIGAPISLVFGRMVGLHQIGYGYLIPLIVAGLILAFMTSKKS